jgi:two-component system nitrate/nitrite response regulator NarL
MPTVLLCSDEPILAEGLSRILAECEDLEFAGSTSATQLRERLEAQSPDLLLLDLTAEVNFALLNSIQEAAAASKIVLWVRAISSELALQAMSTGVRGVLRRTLPVETLVRCLTRVQDGELWFEKTLTDSLMTTRRYSLTRREGQLVALLSQGLKNKEIATAMGISEGSVKVYLSRLFQKLDVKDRFELALFGLKNLTPGQNSLGPARPASDTPMWQAPRSFFVERIPAQSAAANRERLVAWR